MKSLVSASQATALHDPAAVVNVPSPIVLIVVGVLSGIVGAFLLKRARSLTSPDDAHNRDHMQVIGAGLCLCCVICLGFGFFGN